MSFELEYEPLDRAHPDEGSAALLPWDEAVFGFRVAALRIGDATPAGDVDNLAIDHGAIDRWAEANRVELIAAECPAGDAEKRLALERHRFALVDVVVTAVHPRLGRVEIAPPRREPRLATRDDLPRLEEIAAVAFRYGRYHADPFFPRALADARYRQWVRTAFESGDAILVSDSGFFHVVVRGTDLDLRLTAVDPSTDDPWAGADLLHAALRFGQSRGARRAVARLSSANTAVMNLYAASGFRFDHPSAVYHWRSSRMRDGVMA